MQLIRFNQKNNFQLCIIHSEHNSLKLVRWKDYKVQTKDLKFIYQTATEEQALQALCQLKDIQGDKKSRILAILAQALGNLSILFIYPIDILTTIYTTHAIKSLNSEIGHAIKKRKIIPIDDTVKRVIYMAIKPACEKWTMPIYNWKSAMNRIIVEFGDRINCHL